ncbi:uncharacterized protein VNE69_03236 [Vairimorpha necatrix]|uniref:Uncharacterized protein n=1 Tax=Vairimorpha necatrix TaxID=6039 RepID=A0AAX4JAN6_9MICR
MDILKSPIDADSTILALDKSSAYTDLFLSVLRDPNPDLISKLVISNLTKMIQDLKYLIKMKYPKLKSEIQTNIHMIVLLLLGYGINVDTIIINLLRQGYINFPTDHKYFKEYKNALPFIRFHHKEKCPLPLSTTCATLITYDMETDILFIAHVESNIQFYINAFIQKYKNKADDILTFINGKLLSGDNIDCLIKNIYRYGKVYNEHNIQPRDIKMQTKSKPRDINNQIRDIDSQIRDINPQIRDINLHSTKNIKQDINKPNDCHTLLRVISDLSFPSYYTCINNMKNTKVPFIAPALYKEVVFASFGYDNYVQVYLWKILVYQKILFDIEIEIEESDLKTQEALEGYDIYLNIH